jgi:hypothetical protein
MKVKVFVWSFLLVILSSFYTWGWGFAAHKHINRCAVFTLPPALFTFYKHYLGYLTDQAVNPDKRRYRVEGEATKHYIDLDYYGEDAIDKLPRKWDQIIRQYPEKTVIAHGIVPWHIDQIKTSLTNAFKSKSLEKILKLSADLGHYIADANVPLHTTQNYDGQLTGQEGIHGLWETRLPELFKEHYDCFVGQATYVEKPLMRAWEAVIQAHQLVDSVLALEKDLSNTATSFHPFSFEQRGTSLRKVYSEAYATAYHRGLAGQVEQQMRASIKMVGDFWLTCWVDAGEPDLGDLLNVDWKKIHLQEEPASKKRRQLPVRSCGD